MGTYTDFTGAIRITPCLKEPLAGRFRQFLGIRHMKRDGKILEALFPTLEERKAVTLFGDGDFGEDGAFFLPIHGVTEDEMEDMVFRKSVGTCFRCGDPLFLSDIPEYTCQCFRCDEDFYSIEQDVDL